MAPWSVIYKAMKLCACTLLLTMMGLLHYTLRHHTVYTSLTADEMTDHGGIVQWRLEDRGSVPQTVFLTSNGNSWTGRIMAEKGGVRDRDIEETGGWKQERTYDTELATTTAASSTPAAVPTVHQIPKPLPHFNIDNLFQISNETAFLPQSKTRSILSSKLPATKDKITSLHSVQHRKMSHSKKFHSSPNEILSPRTPGGGYVVVLKVYEQQTMASGNLLQLQCWASMLNMSVVTPFMKLSNILTPLDEAKQRAYLSLWDTFNKTHWHKHTQAHGYLPLVDWGDWVNKAPRKVIVVQFRHPLLSRVKEKRKQGIEFPHPYSEDTVNKGCEFKFISGKTLKFLKDKGFVIVRKVCFNFQNGDGFSFTEFKEHLFGSFSPSSVSVILDMWRGLNEPQRVLITNKICREEHPFREQVQPSDRLIRDAQIYKEKFLGPDDYIAVITRFEMTGLSRQHQLSNDTHAEIPLCIKKTLSHLSQLRTDTGIENTFLSIDIGKYGSSSFSKKKYYHHLPEMVEFVRKVHRGRMAMSDIEHTLEHVSRTTDSGYIASLQQLIVTRAKCILFVGGGSFQRHALHMYLELHPQIEQQCIHVVESCTSPNRPIS